MHANRRTERLVDDSCSRYIGACMVYTPPCSSASRRGPRGSSAYGLNDWRCCQTQAQLVVSSIRSTHVKSCRRMHQTDTDTRYSTCQKLCKQRTLLDITISFNSVAEFCLCGAVNSRKVNTPSRMHGSELSFHRMLPRKRSFRCQIYAHLAYLLCFRVDITAYAV